MPKYKLAVDTGGTFTDFCLLSDEGELITSKEPSTPQDPSRAVLRGINNLVCGLGIDPGNIDLVLHGTTVATNAILERKGARTALLVTRGFKDIISIGRQNRPHLYNFRVPKPPPLVPRHLVLEINERMLADGTAKLAPDEREIRFLAARLRETGVESVAVCLLHSYVNPAHETAIKEILAQEIPGLSVTLSSEILPEFREYERASTALINALVRPRVNGYIGGLERELHSAGVQSKLYIMQSNGGVITAGQARQQSARTVLSGPAGGVLAGVRLAALTGYRNLITADMGGTSMDISLIHDGEPRFTTEGGIGGYPLRLPMLDIHTIGAGGGSIAWVDAGGALRVGPHSAGSEPGPACYNLGGNQPTVTDANLVLGRLDKADLTAITGPQTRIPVHTGKNRASAGDYGGESGRRDYQGGERQHGARHAGSFRAKRLRPQGLYPGGFRRSRSLARRGTGARDGHPPRAGPSLPRGYLSLGHAVRRRAPRLFPDLHHGPDARRLCGDKQRVRAAVPARYKKPAAGGLYRSAD